VTELVAYERFGASISLTLVAAAIGGGNPVHGCRLKYEEWSDVAHEGVPPGPPVQRPGYAAPSVVERPYYYLGIEASDAQVVVTIPDGRKNYGATGFTPDAMKSLLKKLGCTGEKTQTIDRPNFTRKAAEATLKKSPVRRSSRNLIMHVEFMPAAGHPCKSLHLWIVVTTRIFIEPPPWKPGDPPPPPPDPLKPLDLTRMRVVTTFGVYNSADETTAHVIDGSHWPPIRPI
jgi:hypothetical protein